MKEPDEYTHPHLAHILIGAAVFARPGQRRVCFAAILGGMLPDVSLYIMAGWAAFVQGIAPQVVFGTLYFSPAWCGYFRLTTGFCHGAGLLHIGSDFLVHHSDARP